MNKMSPLLQDVCEHLGVMPRATAMRVSYATWVLVPGDSFSHEDQRHELDATTLAEAVNLATPTMSPAHLYPKGGEPSFVILETDERADEGHARHTLHFYNVKAKRDWRVFGSANFGQPLKVAIPYAVHSGSLAMNAFDPRRPFDAFADHPGNGRQPGEARMIEARR